MFFMSFLYDKIHRMNIRLSVIVPIYNVELYLSKCLDSLVNQTTSLFEIILVDDGSTDKSSAIAKNYAEQFRNITYLRKSNGGLSDARNYGIDHSTGEFLAFIDSDDYVESTMFEKMLYKQQASNADIVACDMVYIYEDGRQDIAIAGDFDCVDIKSNLDYLGINNSACNKIFRRELFISQRFPVGKSYEDLFIVPILLYRANCVARVNEPLYYYVQRKGSIVHNNNMKMFHIYEAIDNVKDVLEIEVEDKKKFDVLIKRLLIKHGLFLTTLRIKNNGDQQNRIEYFSLNMNELTKRYEKWFSDPSIKEYPAKTQIIFILLKLKMYAIVGRLLKKE